jgi:hypothetical protein
MKKAGASKEEIAAEMKKIIAAKFPKKKESGEEWKDGGDEGFTGTL